MIEYTTLEKLITPAKVLRCGKQSFPVLSMTMHDGIVLQSERFKKSLASTDQSDYKIVKRGQLVVGFPIDEGVLYVQKAADEGIMSPAYNVWDIDAEKIAPDFLELCLHSPQSMQYYKDKLRGTTARRRSIPTADLLALKIRLPDMQAQRKAVAIMRKVETIIAVRQEQLNSFEQLVKSRFVELFGRTKNKIPIGEMCNVTGGYSFKSGDISNDGAIKILQIGNVYLDNVNWETINYLPEGYDEKYSRFQLNEGDIVVALTRPIIQSLGNVKACIVKSNDLPCLLNQRVGRIVAKNYKAVSLDYIYSCLMTDDFTRYVESCSIGCSQPNISTKDIENYLIPNATYEEQKEYVEFKKQTDKSKYHSSLSYQYCQKILNIYKQEWMTCRTLNS